ncbi:hypothetical protein K6L44_13145 [Gluconacetobacter entanii]|jgi:hypothetical protein|uniref:Uncharacterized protein n=1 Tax=Gluconacetobacter entanii TaxID=108528 RepID=A0A318QCB5_9PROT|nr:hypothetical protein [Gluconacetobacter entanii]MBE7620569.1 hypothetical protein [Komagataeibacter sp. FXV2]MCE2579178.1 hypothetical protein [Komagataeibacter sp. FNDCR1]MBY4640908.1 hypothetical protein [Gluconacetobacter entanii]MCW4580527.1 hypothetical protein [Gluconacetobacter entanii]MCW4583852.1 hypothetical protein [Gluconacetobacter entanii]
MDYVRLQRRQTPFGRVIAGVAALHVIAVGVLAYGLHPKSWNMFPSPPRAQLIPLRIVRDAPAFLPAATAPQHGPVLSTIPVAPPIAPPDIARMLHGHDHPGHDK